MVKERIVYLTLFYSIALAFASLINVDSIVDSAPSYGDKVFHFLAYSLLMLVWYAMFTKRNIVEKKPALYFAFIVAVVFGIIIEVIQGRFTETREFDYYDILANVSGGLIMFILLTINLRIQVKK